MKVGWRMGCGEPGYFMCDHFSTVNEQRRKRKTWGHLQIKTDISNSIPSSFGKKARTLVLRLRLGLPC